MCVIDVSVSDLPLNHQQLIKEIDQLRDILPNLGSPVVFSHNDLILENILYDEKAGQSCFTVKCQPIVTVLYVYCIVSI